MSVATDELFSRIKALPEEEKLLLVEAILNDLYCPVAMNPEKRVQKFRSSRK
jgi:hypothetical protein